LSGRGKEGGTFPFTSRGKKKNASHTWGGGIKKREKGGALSSPLCRKRKKRGKKKKKKGRIPAISAKLKNFGKGNKGEKKVKAILRGAARVIPRKLREEFQ